jgi:acyl carrier protein
MIEFLFELEQTFHLIISFDEVDKLLEKKKILIIQDVVNYIEERQLKG